MCGIAGLALTPDAPPPDQGVLAALARGGWQAVVPMR